MEFEAVIGVEVHAEVQTKTKMFCGCAVVEAAEAPPNSAVCPVCAGMPGALPVVNRQAVELALRLGLALECEIAPQSVFARKNYFYPDLPKGYQISQYEQPLARNGRLRIVTSQGERVIHIRRVHLEEDTGKLTHIEHGGEAYSLVDLNRAGVPLLEIVSEPDLRTAEEARAYAVALRSILRYLGVSSGDMQKGALRVEPNISLRRRGESALGTRSEVKNLNSFRALERAVAYEIERQEALLRQGKPIRQETRGWDEGRGATVVQRVKEEAEDYRYFPEPDLPPLVIEPGWIEAVRADLPELPAARLRRFQQAYQLSAYDAGVLVEERAAADYYEEAVAAAGATPKVVANWVSGEIFALLNQLGLEIGECPVGPRALAELIGLEAAGEINHNTAKAILGEMFATGRSAGAILEERGLRQVSDARQIAAWVRQVLEANPEQVAAYRAGKQAVGQWLFGQVMRLAEGRANPQMVREALIRALEGG